MTTQNITLSPATLQARNDMGGYFLDRYTRPDGKLDGVGAMSAIGAVAGAFAHRQALALLAGDTLPEERRTLAKVEGADGRTYWFGDAINYLVFEARGPDLSLFALVAAAAGVPDPDAAIDFEGIFKNAAATAGGAEFGQPRAGITPRPTESALDALQHLPVLKGRLIQLGVPLSDLVLIFGSAAQGLIPMAAGENPDVPTAAPLSRLEAVQLFFEAAIPTSKLDPALAGTE